MPRDENGPVPQQEEFGSGQPKLGDVYRPFDESFDRGMKSHFEQLEKKFDEIKELMRRLEQQLTSQEKDAWQPRLAMEADGPANTKTRKRTEGVATAVQAMHGGSSAQKVQDGPKTSISFCVKAEPPDLPCRDDILVEGGDAAPTSCLPSLEMRTTTAAGGLVPIGKTCTATETTSNGSLLRFYATEETNPKEKNLWDFNSIRLVQQQFLEIASCPLRPEGYRDKTDAK